MEDDLNIHSRPQVEKMPARNADEIRRVMDTWNRFLDLIHADVQDWTASGVDDDTDAVWFSEGASAYLMARAAGEACGECEDCQELFGEEEDE